jgi:hypothetical protein
LVSVTTSNDTSYDEVGPQSPAFHRLETLSPGNWSPAVSEWSVSDWGFLFNPQWVIEEAISRLFSQAAPSFSASVASSDPSNAPSTPASAENFHPTGHRSQYPVFLDTRDSSSAELQEALYYWIYEGRLHQQDHLCFEDDMGSEPAHMALRTLHGPLNAFIDYPAMAVHGAQDLQNPSFFPLDFSNIPPIADDLPNASTSPTSLDFSLPMSNIRSTLETVNEEPEEFNGNRDAATTPEESSSHNFSITIDASQVGIQIQLMHPDTPTL